MSEAEPLRLRLDSDAGPELRLALRELPSEAPSDAQVGALRARLAAEVGEPVRLRAERPASQLKTALGVLPEEAPSLEQLRALRSRLPQTTAAPKKPRLLKPKKRAAVVLAWLLPAAAAAMSGAYYATRSDEPESPPVASVTLPEARLVEPSPLPSASIEPLAPSASAAPTASTPPLKRAPTSASAPVDPEAELRLMREAQAALGSNPARALELAAQHAQQFPRGVLGQEREVVAIDALNRLGRASEARARAARFRKSHPESAYLPRIDRLVGPAAPAPSSSL